MTPHPPRVPTFLMRHVGRCSPALMGDLVEELAAGASRRWYWREAFAATARSILSVVRRHPVVLLRAIVAYEVLFGVFTFVIAVLVRHMPVLLDRVSLSSYLRLPVLDFVRLMVTLPVCAFAGWTVARLHASVRVPATVVIIALWFIRDIELRRLLSNIDDVRFVPYLMIHLLVLTQAVCGLLIGGMFLPARRDSDVSMPGLGNR